MSAKKTVFPAAVQYQKEKFDPSLKLQRMPDTSQQAMQPFLEEGKAIEIQANIEQNFAALQDQVDLQQLRYGEPNKTFLQQLAPFSNLIKQEIAEYDQRWDERRKRTADEIAGKMALEARNSQDTSQITRDTNEFMSRAWKTGRGDLVHGLSKLDWAMQAQVAEAFVKQDAKTYGTSFDAFKATRGPITDDAQAQAAISDHDNRVRDYLESVGAEPEVWESWKLNTRDERQKALTKMINKNRGLQGEEIRQTTMQGVYGGMSILDAERRIALSPYDKDRAYGKAKTHTFMLDHFKKAIAAGLYNQKDIDRWKTEIHPITKKPIGEDKNYAYFFGQMQLFLDKRKSEDAATFEETKEKTSDDLINLTVASVLSGEVTVSDEMVKQIEREAFSKGLDSPRLTKMIEYLNDGLTVEDRAVEFLENELKTRLDQSEVIPEIEMLKYGQDLYQKYSNINEANKKTQAFQERKDLLKEGAAWLQQDEAQAEGGGGLDITSTDSVKTQGEIRLLSEWEALLKDKFDKVMATAKPEDDVYKTGTINGQSVKDTALTLAIKDFEKLKNDPKSVFYKDPGTGQFSNTVKIKTNIGYVGTDAANKTYGEVTSKIANIQKLAESTTFGYKDIVTQKSLLSQVISKGEAMTMKENIEKGKGIPAAILAIAALGGDGQLLTAQRIFNTYDLGNIEIPARNEKLAERLADPKFVSNFNVDEFMNQLGNIHRMGPREQQRTKDNILKQAAAAEGMEKPALGMQRVNYVAAQNVTPEARALLRTLMWAEGTDKMKSKAYGTHYGYEYTPPTGNHPDRVIHKNGISSAAYGAYQFMPQTWAGTSFGREGLPMTPENQDLAALELVRQRFVNPDEELTSADWDRLTPEWASIPHSTTNRGIYAGQRGKTLVELNRIYKQFLREERYNQSIRGLI